MTIWLLALVLLASLAGIGLRQGGIRVAFSLVGILLAALLASPLGKLFKPLLSLVGMKDPLLLGIVAPLIAFLLVSIVFKVAAMTVHQKVDVYYKYHAGDLRLALWERVHHRLGLCLGLVNGTAYLILISWVIYSMSYWTAQTATSDSDPWQLRLLNRMGKDLHASGFARVAKSIDPLSESYYQTADVAGLLYNNPLLEARLTRYPAFLSLSERKEFQDLASDQGFTEMRQRRDSIWNVIHHTAVQALLQNRDLMTAIHTALVPNLKDLSAYLETGRSPKFESEPILGRWQFDLTFSMLLFHRAKPNISTLDLQKQKRASAAQFAKTSLVATTEHTAFLKSVPRVIYTGAGTPGTEVQTVDGKWSGGDGNYVLTMSGGKGELAAKIENDRLLVRGDALEMAFIRED